MSETPDVVNVLGLQGHEDLCWGELALRAADEPSSGVPESMEYLRRRFFEQDPDAAD